jgi:hypothetical protein
MIYYRHSTCQLADTALIGTVTDTALIGTVTDMHVDIDSQQTQSMPGG